MKPSPFPPHILEKVAARRVELNRLYGLTDRWLAQALIQLCRTAQKERPEWGPNDQHYNSDFVWSVVPEVARRLGYQALLSDEIDWEIRGLSDYDLRITVGNFLANLGAVVSPAWDILSGEACNGNPVVFAMDRLCPGQLSDNSDLLVKRIKEIAARRDVPYDGVWRLDMLRERQCA